MGTSTSGAFAAALSLAACVSAAQFEEMWRDRFDNGLDPGRWVITGEGDARRRVADVDVAADGRHGLRLLADTMGGDETLTYVGVRTRRPIDLSGRACISARLDWNHQANGSYLTAALILASTATDGNALGTTDWLRVEYIGTPPGQWGRLEVGSSRGGSEKLLETEGWPSRREGRSLGVLNVDIRLRRGRIEVEENGVQRCSALGESGQ